jgi:hypothetical protein
MIMQYGIATEDIFNFDETGYAMGLTATAKIVTRAEIYGRRHSYTTWKPRMGHLY